MKKIFIALTSIAMLALTACEPKNQPEQPNQPTDSTAVGTDTIADFTVPKKHLIEEFTGQGCGYCPYGMDGIHEFMGNDTNWVLILHHYGYAADHFSVSGSKTITSALGVSGAPSAAIDRAKTRTADGNKIVFHPGYLPDADKSQFATTTYATINIANEFDESSRELKVRVSGLIGKRDYGNLKLTVVVKESGMIDTQADYYNTYEGWQEFRHANAVRAFLTAAKGDAIEVTEDSTRHYEVELATTIKDEWVAGNCMVVAFLSEDFKPVVQAEQKPVVAGTQGGADILHGGITPVPVADYYPEPDATSGPGTFSNNKNETLNNATGWYENYQGKKLWTIQAYNTASTVTIGGTVCVPFAFLYLFTDAEATAIPEGTYAINTSGEAGTVMAGFRDDESFTIDGSAFYFTSLSYLNQGYLVPSAQWMIAEGEMTVSAKGWNIRGKALNGSSINLVGSTAIQNGGQANAPAKRIQTRKEKERIDL